MPEVASRFRSASIALVLDLTECLAARDGYQLMSCVADFGEASHAALLEAVQAGSESVRHLNRPFAESLSRKLVTTYAAPSLTAWRPPDFMHRARTERYACAFGFSLICIWS
jgi:hypothetical protein